MSEELISEYAARLKPEPAAICACLREAIDDALPKATARISHRMPAWFIGENPVVGYFARPRGVTLLFWNGQRFGDPMLTAVGKFYAAQIRYADVTEIDENSLRRWLRKSRTQIWDLAGTRNRLLAPRHFY